MITLDQRKDQFVSLTLCFTTQQVDRQREYKTKGNETMAYHHGGEGGKGWLSAKVLRVALREDEKTKKQGNREVFQAPVCDGGEKEM